jgi:hypothetical protein
MRIATRLDTKRNWNQRALNAFKTDKDNVVIMYFCIGLTESGFKKNGEYAGVERWFLADSSLSILVNTNNATWSFDNQQTYIMRESDDFFEVIRRAWSVLTSLTKDV